MSSLSMELIPQRLRRDPQEYGPRLRCRVDVIPQGTSIPGNDRPAKRGVSEVTIATKDLPLLQAKVETEWDKFAQATELHEQRKKKFIAEVTGLPLPENRAEWAPEHVRAEGQYGLTSPHSVFRELMERDVRPIRSLEVLEDLPPEQDERLQMARDVARELAGFTQASTGPRFEAQQSSDLDELRAIVAQQAAQIQALQAQQAPRPRGRPKKAAPVT